MHVLPLYTPVSVYLFNLYAFDISILYVYDEKIGSMNTSEGHINLYVYLTTRNVYIGRGCPPPTFVIILIKNQYMDRRTDVGGGKLKFKSILYT